MKRFLACVLIGLTAGGFPGARVYAAPVGGQVSAGSATISSAGVKTDIHQHTGKAVIDWRGFDIAPGEHTQFHQPSRDSFTLNRVNAATPSQIDGRLTANGNIMIVNPNGVIFGAGSKVDVGGLIASTADISNKDFMDGKFHFATPGNPDAKIVNKGSITARDAGLVGLVAPQVENSGVIEARLGKVRLGSGDSFTLDYYGDGLINLKASDAITKQLVSNSGAITADGGKIHLTAAAARDHVDSLVEAGGTLRANAIASKNGEIILYAEGGTTQVSGQITATSDTAKGGNIDVLGKKVALLENADINTSGATGGGRARIGGAYQGGGTTPTAKQTYVDKTAAIKADATKKGDGGPRHRLGR